MGKLITSKRLNYIVKNSSEKIYYHALFGNAKLIDSNTEKILDYFKEGKKEEDIFEEFNLTSESRIVVRTIIEDLKDSYYLIKESDDEEKILQNKNKEFVKKACEGFPFEFIGFNITHRCNFACKYCIAGANKIIEEENVFEKEKIKYYIFKFANELIENKKSTLNIGFTGGEPLLRWNDFKEIVEDTYKMYSEKLNIEIFINTNVSLVTDDIAHFFATHNVHPSTSLDGVRQWNNKVRIGKNGKGTFDDIMNGIHTLRRNEVECSGFYLTLTCENFDFDVDELIQFAKNNEFRSITIEPDLVKSLAIENTRLCQKLLECYEKGQANGINITGFWKRPYKNMVDFRKSNNGFCRALGLKSIVITSNGYLSPCGYSSLELTKIHTFKELCMDERYIKFIEDNLRGNIAKCKGCPIEGTCKGGCLMSRDTNKVSTFDYRCCLYLKMTELLLKRANFHE